MGELLVENSFLKGIEFPDVEKINRMIMMVWDRAMYNHDIPKEARSSFIKGERTEYIEEVRGGATIPQLTYADKVLDAIYHAVGRKEDGDYVVKKIRELTEREIKRKQCAPITNRIVGKDERGLKSWLFSVGISPSDVPPAFELLDRFFIRAPK